MMALLFILGFCLALEGLYDLSTKRQMLRALRALHRPDELGEGACDLCGAIVPLRALSWVEDLDPDKGSPGIPGELCPRCSERLIERLARGETA